MAKHRINQNGHIMWFDTDEEYYNYLDMQDQLEKRERQRGRRIRFIIALIALIMLYNWGIFCKRLSVVFFCLDSVYCGSLS